MDYLGLKGQSPTEVHEDRGGRHYYYDYDYLFSKLQKELSVRHFDSDDHCCGPGSLCSMTAGLSVLMSERVMLKNVQGFLKLTPSTLGHKLINHPSYSAFNLRSEPPLGWYH